MDQKTEELRDIFMTVADDETVTERQEESPGTLTGEQSVDDRLDALISRMRERYRFRTDCDAETLRSIARSFYADEPDEAIGEQLDEDPETVFTARLDLHLVSDDDHHPDLPSEELRRLSADDPDVSELADRFDISADIIERALKVAEAEGEMRRSSYRFRDEFDSLLGDGDVAEQLPGEVTDDGLDDATEGLEVNTSF